MAPITEKTAKSYLSVGPSLLFVLVFVGASLTFLALYTWDQTVLGLGISLFKGEIAQVISPANATVLQWFVEEGDEIEALEKVALIKPHDEPMSVMVIPAPSTGYLAEIIAYPQTTVSIGESLALITALGDKKKDLEIVGFVSSLQGKILRPGMKALVWPSFVSAEREGAIRAVVKRVGKLPTSKAALKSLVKIPELAKYIRNRIEGEPFLVILSLVSDEEHRTGYSWTGPGPSYELDYGVIADFSIIYEEPSLLSRLWPSLYRKRELKR